jgi:hypothetical protein
LPINENENNLEEYFHKMEKLEHQYIMSEFKTEICQELNHKSNEEQSNCMNYHISDGRRKIFGKNRRLTHSNFKCENVECKDINCLFAHNDLEINYHPLKYKTEACKSMSHIKVRVYK